jgi:hypothetical protein
LCPRKGIGIIGLPPLLFDPFRDDLYLELPVMMMYAPFQHEHDDMVASTFIEHHHCASGRGCVTILYHPQVLDEKVYPTVYADNAIEKFAALV